MLKKILRQKTIFAFNIDDLVIFKAVTAAAEKTNLPLIVQLSPGEVEFWHLRRFVALVRLAQRNGLPLFLNIDHGREERVLKEAVTLGFDLVHFDGSDLDWEENIKRTQKIVSFAHSQGVLVEGEPNGESTEPAAAAEFVRRTGVDLLAVFAGNRHGYDPQKPERLEFSRLKAIKEAVGKEVFLTLHGGSGVPEGDLRRAIKEGLIKKINVNSLLRWRYRRSLEKSLAAYSGTKVYQIFSPVAAAVEEEVSRLLKLVANNEKV